MKHRGWKSIALVCGCSVRTAQKMAYHPEQGQSALPVRKDAVGVFLEHREFEEWSPSMSASLPTAPAPARDTRSERLSMAIRDLLKVLFEDMILDTQSPQKCAALDAAKPRTAA